MKNCDLSSLLENFSEILFLFFLIKGFSTERLKFIISFCYLVSTRDFRHFGCGKFHTRWWNLHVLNERLKLFTNMSSQSPAANVRNLNNLLFHSFLVLLVLYFQTYTLFYDFQLYLIIFARNHCLKKSKQNFSYNHGIL